MESSENKEDKSQKKSNLHENKKRLGGKNNKRESRKTEILTAAGK
jgi:hypothetical protein